MVIHPDSLKEQLAMPQPKKMPYLLVLFLVVNKGCLNRSQYILIKSKNVQHVV